MPHSNVHSAVCTFTRLHGGLETCRLNLSLSVYEAIDKLTGTGCESRIVVRIRANIFPFRVLIDAFFYNSTNKTPPPALSKLVIIPLPHPSRELYKSDDPFPHQFAGIHAVLHVLDGQ